MLFTSALAVVLIALAPLPDDAPAQDAQGLLSRLKASRAALTKGVFRARGHMERRSPRGGKVEGGLVVYSAFDIPKGLLRLDRTEPAPLLAEEGNRLPAVAKSKVICTPEMTATWFNVEGGDSIMRSAVGIHPAEMELPPHLFPPFDARSLALAPWSDRFQEAAPFEHAFAAWSESRAIDVTRPEEGLFELRLRQGKSGTYIPQTLVLDERQGFSPVRLTYEVPVRGKPSVVLHCNARWKQVAGVWVPQAYQLEVNDPARGSRKLDLAFEWTTVNKDIDPAVLEPAKLDVPPGTEIVDYRGTQPVRVGEIPREKEFIVGIGVALDNNDHRKIIAILPGGPAAKDGRLKVGDMIMCVEKDGKFVDLDPRGSALELIGGKAGTKVSIAVESKGSDKRVVYELVREAIPVPTGTEP